MTQQVSSFVLSDSALNEHVEIALKALRGELKDPSTPFGHSPTAKEEQLAFVRGVLADTFRAVSQDTVLSLSRQANDLMRGLIKDVVKEITEKED